jgi:mono/diheme cytochrome c family protein
MDGVPVREYLGDVLPRLGIGVRGPDGERGGGTHAVGMGQTENVLAVFRKRSFLSVRPFGLATSSAPQARNHLSGKSEFDVSSVICHAQSRDGGAPSLSALPQFGMQRPVYDLPVL